MTNEQFWEENLNNGYDFYWKKIAARDLQDRLQAEEKKDGGWECNKLWEAFKLEQQTQASWDDRIQKKIHEDDSNDVDSPAHYNAGEIETIDYIVDVLGEFEAAQYCHGNVLKYTGHRLFNKGNPVKDARKAIWYLNKMVELLESCEGVSW